MMSEFAKEIREEIAQEKESKPILAAPEKESYEKRCYTAEEIQAILGICRKSTYALLKRKEFHWFKIGSNYRIPKKSFDQWLDSTM